MKTFLLSTLVFAFAQFSCTPAPSKSAGLSSTSQRVYQRDPQIGCYYLNEKGEKVATVDSNCDKKEPAPSQSNSSSSTGGSSYSSSSPNYTGPRGGTYHYTKSGKKSYYKRKN
jgi:hypothetical protein